MKKALSLVLVLVMCLSLLACGSGPADTTTASHKAEASVPKTTASETTTPETTAFQYPFLIDEEWKDIYSDQTMVFYQDGTGIRNGSAIEWKVVGNFIFVTRIANGYTTEYDLVEKNNIWRIVSKDGKNVFVGENGYDIVFETERPVATITCHDGSIVKLTAKEIYRLNKENSGIFKQLYLGADITFVGTIKEISCDVYDSALWVSCDYIQFEEGWYLQLYHGIYTELLLTLSAGTKLEVHTQLYSASLNEDQIAVKGTTEEGGYGAATLKKTTIVVVEDEE